MAWLRMLAILGFPAPMAWDILSEEGIAAMAQQDMKQAEKSYSSFTHLMTYGSAAAIIVTFIVIFLIAS